MCLKKISEIVGVLVRPSERWTFSLIQAYHFCVMSTLTGKEQARSLGNGLRLVWSDISITAVCSFNSGKISSRGNVEKKMTERKMYVIRNSNMFWLILTYLFLTYYLWLSGCRPRGCTVNQKWEGWDRQPQLSLWSWAAGWLSWHNMSLATATPKKELCSAEGAREGNSPGNEEMGPGWILHQFKCSLFTFKQHQ